MTSPGAPEAADDGGIYGRWSVDESGLPEFEYTLDQRTDERAIWDTRAFGETTLHWHQIGNDRISARATNEGWVEMYSHEHGPRWINHQDPEAGSHSGGVSYLRDRESGATFSTFYSDLPQEAKVRRVFGCGYFTVSIRIEDLELERTVFAPFGESRLLASHVVVRNHGTSPRRLTHGEFWDVRLHNIDYFQADGSLMQIDVRRQRAEIIFGGYGADWDDEIGGLRARHPLGRAIYDMAYFVRNSPNQKPDVILAPIETEVSGWSTSRADVFGQGGRSNPLSLEEPTARPHPSGGTGQEVAFLLNTDLELEPGEETTLGFAFGAAPPNEVGLELGMIGGDIRSLLEATRSAWSAYLPKVRFGREEWLSRELAWDAYYVRSGATYHEGFRSHTISQGGAYQYLVGYNAGPRATLQHAQSLVWLAPELAADLARFTMAETLPQGEIPYQEQMGGLVDNIFEAPPSDGDLWLLWIVAEYTLATRDRAFLRSSVSYWPAPYTRPEPVWDHCVRALDHLLNDVGIGPHGLLKMRPGGDWNDILPGEVAETTGVSLDTIFAEGESTWNTGMAVHVLRRFAELASYAGDPGIARRCTEQAEAFAEALRQSWRGKQLIRGWADREHDFGHTDLYLEPQAWALINGILTGDQDQTLIDEIRERCSDQYATRVFASAGEGMVPGAVNGVWASINSTLAWGMGRVRPEEGWKELLDNTFHKHALVYPHIWSGIWSAADMCYPLAGGEDTIASMRRHQGFEGSPDVEEVSAEELAGRPYSVPGLSMQAWPVQIMFSHSEPLNATQWLLGFRTSAKGLEIDPLLPFNGWEWDGGLLQVSYSDDSVSGELGALAADVIDLVVRLPDALKEHELRVVVNEEPVLHRLDDDHVTFRMAVMPGKRTSFAIGR